MNFLIETNLLGDSFLQEHVLGTVFVNVRKKDTYLQMVSTHRLSFPWLDYVATHHQSRLPAF
jgi:hypothetical protein